MTPQERELLSNLVARLRQSPQQQRDTEADAMIGDLVRERPDTPYILAQTVLIQDYSLHQAQARIAELEQQLQGQRPREEGGFLSSIFGSSRAPQGAPPPRQQPQYQSQPQPQAYQQPYPQQPAGPWGQAPAQQVFAQPSAQPSFLRSAATTAAGVAGGALLFQGIESLLGGHAGYGGYGGAAFGGFAPQPGLTETVINNYYGDSAGDTRQAADRQADYQQADNRSDAPDQGDYSDASYDDSGSYDDGGDFGGDDV